MHKDLQKYQDLHSISRRTALLQGISHLLEWDQETYMPSDASAIRGEQLETMAGLLHEKRTGKEFTSALSKLIDLKTGEISSKDLNISQVSALKRWRRDYIHATALPKEFVEEFARLSSQSLEVWKKARADNAYHHFAPFLDKIISMNRKKAEYLGYKDHPYDALLDLYEPENNKEKTTILFNSLKKFLVPLLKKVSVAKQISNDFLFGNFDHQKQLDYSRQLLDSIGYVTIHGRLDTSAHPFSTSLHPTDSRITTRLHSKSLMSSILSTLHEGGHALYEQGLPTEHFGSPLGEAISLGMHESQSRWWETRIGQSKAFWQHQLPILKKHFKSLNDLSLDDFYKAINKVQPSLIRVEADEMTYPLHVILRTELECALIDGSLSVRDLPEAWNAKMQELVGVTPPTNSDGCLQDVHWSMGAIGYFPTYVLGNLYGAHLFQSFEKDHPDWTSNVAEGNLKFIKTWLNDAVYKHGREYNSLELLEKRTGKEFTSKAYIEYLQKKYGEIYQL